MDEEPSQILNLMKVLTGDTVDYKEGVDSSSAEVFLVLFSLKRRLWSFCV